MCRYAYCNVGDDDYGSGDDGGDGQAVIMMVVTA
jgi:hypothetical protein